MLILLANTHGPQLFACQPSTPDTAAQGQAGWGRRGAIECEFMTWEWCTSLRVETSLCCLPNNNHCNMAIENENSKRTSHSCWWVFVRHRRDHRQSQELHPGTIDTLQLCFIILRPAKFQAQYDTAAPGRPRVRPCQGLRERVDLICIIIMRHDSLDFLLPILEFLTSDNSASRSLKSLGRISSLILTTSVRIIAHDSRRKSCHNFVYHRK